MRNVAFTSKALEVIKKKLDMQNFHEFNSNCCTDKTFFRCKNSSFWFLGLYPILSLYMLYGSTSSRTLISSPQNIHKSRRKFSSLTWKKWKNNKKKVSTQLNRECVPCPPRLKGLSYSPFHFTLCVFTLFWPHKGGTLSRNSHTIP